MRNYNKEIIDNDSRKYAYNFDLDVIHPYMLKLFKPFFVNGNALELGCFKGAFTKRLLSEFNDITCIEASSEAIDIARDALNNKVKFICSRFEDVNMVEKYKNIFMTHVLEHIDCRVEILKKINDFWLDDDGVFFVACPNAHAPSRQIAVKMGLINNCEDITEGEREHGHRITYTLTSLRAELEQSGLEIVHESGIFFKAFANFQWDMLLNTEIITKDYLDGCYELGKEYPDLCSSIVFVCKKGKSE